MVESNVSRLEGLVRTHSQDTTRGAVSSMSRTVNTAATRGRDWGAAATNPWTAPSQETLVPGGIRNADVPYARVGNLDAETITSGILNVTAAQNEAFMHGLNLTVEPKYSYYYDNFTICEWNDSWCGDGINTTGGPDAEIHYKYWALILSLFPMLTVFGNVLVVLSVWRERNLQTVTNYFLVSLAIADIMVAALVMPLAVQVEVTDSHWFFSDTLCDVWVAFDVMCCTSSILHLTAISIDRFIAVTQPIKYARHKNSKRVFIMLALTWIVSASIALPIVLGMNYSPDRRSTLCIFYNSDFIIYSSMGSFYVPCVVMLVLYWKIFKVIRERARKSNSHKKHKLENKNLKHVLAAKKAQAGSTDASTTDNSGKELIPMPMAHRKGGSGSGGCTTPIMEESTFTHVQNTDSLEESDEPVTTVKPEKSEPDGATGVNGGHVISNDKSADVLSPVSEDSHDVPSEKDSGYSAPTNVEVEDHKSPNNGSPKRTFLSIPKRNLYVNLQHKRNGATSPKPPRDKALKLGEPVTPKKIVTRFNFHLRHHSKKKKGRDVHRKERKATKTLAIVLGVFLFCWVPFFTLHFINALCIRYELHDRPECNIDAMLFSFFVWLGYINSFLNPVIYTIFNIEFRKAFKKLLNC